MGATSVFPVALAFLAIFLWRSHQFPAMQFAGAQFALLRLLRIMTLVNNVTAIRRRSTLLMPFRERL